MAKQTLVHFVDDLDGKDLKEAVTVTFGVDGKTYEFDTSPAHAREFQRGLEKYVAASRRVSGGGRRSSSRRSRRGSRAARRSGDAQRVRTWARENGYEVSERGRISAEVMAAYEADQ